MLALASSALSLPAQQQKLAIAPDNSTAPLPELNLLTHFRAWTCGERMYRLAPKDAGCPKFTAPLMDKGAPPVQPPAPKPRTPTLCVRSPLLNE